MRLLWKRIDCRQKIFLLYGLLDHFIWMVAKRLKLLAYTRIILKG